MALIWAVCVVSVDVTSSAGSPLPVYCVGVLVSVVFDPVVCVCSVSLCLESVCVQFWSV